MQIILNWANTDTVLLDMDGTLLELHFDNFFWLNHLSGYYTAKFPSEKLLTRNALTRKLSEKQGTLEWYFTKFWSDGLSLDSIVLKKQIGHLISERPQSLLLLQALGRHNTKRVLVTNAHPDCVTIKFSATCIDSLLDQVISSHDYGCPKEFSNFWNALQKRSPFNPTKTLFIDNSIAVLNTTKNYGIANIVYIDKPDSTQSSSPFAEFSSISHLAELLIIDEAFHNG